MEADASSLSIIWTRPSQLARESDGGTCLLRHAQGLPDLTRVECSKLLEALNDTEDTRLHIFDPFKGIKLH